MAYVEVDATSFSKAQEATLPVTFHGLFTAASPRTLRGLIEIAKVHPSRAALTALD